MREARSASYNHFYLQGLSADEIIDARELSGAGSPLDKERWAGAVDSLGSRTLANVLSQIKYDGAVAACGFSRGVKTEFTPASVTSRRMNGMTVAGRSDPCAKPLLRGV
jgi:acrylyl-CoA reductase (NADPH)